MTTSPYKYIYGSNDKDSNDVTLTQLRAIEEHGVELRRQQRDEMKQRVEEWNAKRRENGEEVLEGSDYSALYQQMSAQERYKDAHDILAPIENSYKQLEHYLDGKGKKHPQMIAGIF